MKVFLFILILFVKNNSSQIFQSGETKNHNDLKQQLHKIVPKNRNVFHITTNIYIDGHNGDKMVKPFRHPNCPLYENPEKPTHLPYPGNCGKFYKCLFGFAYTMNCPENLEWSFKFDRCEFPEIANCDPNATTTLRTTDDTTFTSETLAPTTPNKEKAIKHPNCPIDEDPATPIHLPYPGNCGKFYKCSGGYAYPMNCPTGLEWSIQLDRCDYPENANCDPNATKTLRTTDTTKSSSETLAPTTPDKEKPTKHPNCPVDENPATPTHLPYPGNCGKFYKCSGGYAFPMDCPAGLEWSIQLDRCDYPEIAKCDPSATTTLRTTDTTKSSSETLAPTTPDKEKPTKHPNCPVDENPATPTHLPYPGNCGKFYKCSGGYAFPMDCPAGLEWSIQLDRCDYPEIAKCDPSATTTLRTTDTTKSTSETLAPTTPDKEKPTKHPNCPVDENPATPTHLPYPGNCGKFYKCSGGYAFPMDCPAGLEWSIQLDRCDYPEIAKCDPSATTTLRTTDTTKSSSETLAPTTPDKEKPTKHPNCPVDENPATPTHLPYPGNCGKFYKCSGGYAFPMDCPAGLEWSIHLDRCDYPEIAKCDPSATTTLRTTDTTKSSSETLAPTTPDKEKPTKHPNCPVDENPATPTHLPYPGNCGKFYKCSGGYAFPMDCPAGLEWSIQLDRCDYPEIAKCDPSATTTLRTTDTTKSSSETLAPTTPDKEKPTKHSNCPVDENPATPTHLPYPGNCGKFYKCSGGYAFPMDCPAGLEWSIQLDRCDYPEIAKCDPSATTTLRTTDTTKSTSKTLEPTTPDKEKPTKHPNCPVDENPATPTHLPYPGNCGKFYKCSGGYAFPMDCPAGLEWSIQLDRCDYPEIAKCDPSATTTLRTTDTTKSSSETLAPTTPDKEKPTKHPNCPVDENSATPTHLPYPGNCGKFYKCSGGYAFPMDCPAGLEWSIQLDRCDYPEIAKCDPSATTTLRTTDTTKSSSETLAPTTPDKEKPTKHPNCPVDEDPATPTHLPYLGDCGKFYKCNGGYAFPMDCPAGLEWSIELDRCEYPEIAKCNPLATTTLRSVTDRNHRTEFTTHQSDDDKIFLHPACPIYDNIEREKSYIIYLPYPGKCGKYFKCTQGYAVPKNCPHGLHWSVKYSRCDWPSKANCIEEY